jgi:2'-5' RNA ligase
VQLGFAILLPDDAHNLLRRLQLRVAQECGGPTAALNQIPHITLKLPFDAKSVGPIETYFDELVASVRPFEIHFCGIDTFAEDGVIFLDVEPKDELETLRLRVLDELRAHFRVKPSEVEDERYRVHSSISFGLEPEKLRCAVDALAGEKVDVRFTFDTLGMFYNTGDMWIVYKRLRPPRGPVQDRRRSTTD